MERKVVRLVAVQHLRSAFRIKTKNWNNSRSRSSACSSTKVFGVPLESLGYYNMECGSVPSFLVDACRRLLADADTEGLFRKSGSVLRLKALRARVDQEEACLSSAPPCDVAGLVKQFFRELPEPALPSELQESFLKAQQLSSEEERTAATLLLSCLLPDRNLFLLQYFFQFLHNVSLRSSENKMDSRNLSVILAPNLLHVGDGVAEKMSAQTEKRLRLQAAVVRCFIDNAHSFGVLPAFLQDKVPAMMGGETLPSSPSRQQPEEAELNSGMKRKQRRSFGDVVGGALTRIKTNRTPSEPAQAAAAVFSSATPLAATPSSKRKLPLEAAHFVFSSKKRRSVKPGLSLLPNPRFSGASTPGSVSSASGVLEASEALPSPAARTRRHSASSGRRKSRRVSSRHVVSRVESGRSGCFSPKVKKEVPRRSLRLRFSLGKSSREPASESVGLRLASQESSTAFHFSTETAFSPSLRPEKPPESTVSTLRSHSEDNLLTPSTSWTPVGAPGSAPSSSPNSPITLRLRSTFVSEPVIVTAPGDAHLKQRPEREFGPGASGRSHAPPLDGHAPFMDSSTDLQERQQESDGVLPLPAEAPSEHGESSTAEAELPDVTFGVFDFQNLTPLHIDSRVLDGEEGSSPMREEDEDPEEEGEEPIECSRLIEALDIQSPAHFPLLVSSTPLRPQPGPSKQHAKEVAAVPPPGDAPEFETKVQNPPPSPPLCSLEAERRRRVAEHIRHFNKLTLQSPRSAQKLRPLLQPRPPLSFQRTPVRQAVRRINSMLGERSRNSTPHAAVTTAMQPFKVASLDSGLTSVAPPTSRKTPPPVPPKTTSLRIRACGALGDVTNTVQTKTRTHGPDPDPPGSLKTGTQQDQIHLKGPPRVPPQDPPHYRGSPRNPLNASRLLSATRPVDL